MKPVLSGRFLVGFALAGVLLTPARAAEAPAEPPGYRLDDYGAATPATLAGAPGLTTEQAKELWTRKAALFVDVLPHVPKPAGLPAGTIWHDKPHPSIRGAQWLPDVGRGSLAPETDDYFQRSLAELTHHDFAQPLVIFCKKSCWMSWNAAKRAESYGYTHVFWYGDGMDGWAGAALPVEFVQPHT